jgi:hypothetical protein
VRIKFAAWPFDFRPRCRWQLSDRLFTAVGLHAHNVGMKRAPRWLLILTALIACLVVGYLRFIDRAGRRTYQNFVALDGKDPLFTDPPWDGPDTVVLYRTGRNDVICFDAFYSKELHDRLSAKNGKLITVEYDTFNDFGKVSGYNVHSVDGLILANGSHVLHDFREVAGVRANGPGSAGSDDCW